MTRKMATYNEIAKVAAQIGGLRSVKSCWIAHVLSDHGLTKRQAHNRLDPSKREYVCPPDKRPAIVEALRRLGMI